jgi:hypothetical protein
MPATSFKLDPQELVQKKYPNSFVNDDGEWVYIRVKKSRTEICSHCGQSWTHQVTDYDVTLGSGGSESDAWQNAALNLGLI